jgi:hypothetical protein
MQVDTTSREGPGRALEQAAQAYLRSLHGVRRDEPSPSLSEETIDTLRRVITSDLGGRASLHVRRRLVLDEFARRLSSRSPLRRSTTRRPLGSCVTFGRNSMKQYRPYVDARFAGLVSSPCDARPPPAGCRVLQEATMAVLPPARPVGPAWLAASGERHFGRAPSCMP